MKSQYQQECDKNSELISCLKKSRDTLRFYHYLSTKTLSWCYILGKTVIFKSRLPSHEQLYPEKFVFNQNTAIFEAAFFLKEIL